jgi:hypothetical protein
MMPRLLALAALAALTACAAPSGPQQARRSGCVFGPVQVANLSSQPVEQLYLGAPADWGADRLAGGLLAPGAALELPRPGPMPFSLRAVWVNGRAAEFPNLDGCTVSRIEIGDTGMRAQ